MRQPTSRIRVQVLSSRIVKAGSKDLTLYSLYTHFNTLNKKALQKYYGKRWNCLFWAISPFYTMFSIQSVILNSFIATFQLPSAASLNLGPSQNGVLGNGLMTNPAHHFHNFRCLCDQWRSRSHYINYLFHLYSPLRQKHPACWSNVFLLFLAENVWCAQFELLLFTTQSRLLTPLYGKPFENIVGKGENAGNQHFLLFPHCFLPF